MANYTLEIFFKQNGSYYSEQIVGLLSLFCQTLGITSLFDNEDNKIDITNSTVDEIIEYEKKSLKFGDVGVNFDLFTIAPKERNSETKRIEIHTAAAADSRFINFMMFRLAEDYRICNDTIIKTALKLFNPVELYVSDSANELELDSYNKKNQYKREVRPAIIRNVHFLSEGQIITLGGEEKLLKLPVYKAEKVQNGILLQILAEPFDNNNTEHKKKQAEIHRILNI